ncbi:MAG: hypothetical protein KBS99_07405 [Prevotellaceae bacterium]|nr:hypothetical protein [Candidatus Colivivens caballi]
MAKKIFSSESLAEMLPDEELYLWDTGKNEEWICEDCFTDRRNELSNREFAELIDSEVRTAEDFLYDC